MLGVHLIVGLKTLHNGLKNTLTNKVNLNKLETVFKVVDLMEL